VYDRCLSVGERTMMILTMLMLLLLLLMAI